MRLKVVVLSVLPAVCLLATPVRAAAPAKAAHTAPAKAAPVMSEAMMAQLIKFARDLNGTGAVDGKIAKVFGLQQGAGDFPLKLAHSELSTDKASHYLGVPVDPASKDVLLLIKRDDGVWAFLTDSKARLRGAVILHQGEVRLIPNEAAAGPFRTELALFSREFTDQLFLSKQIVTSEGLKGPGLNAVFRRIGVSIHAPADQPVVLMDSRYIYGGEAVGSARGNIVLMQQGGRPCQYVMEFDALKGTFDFNRSGLIAGRNGITHPVWTATAQDANGLTLSSVGEAEIRSFTDVPPRRFHLQGPGIKRIVFHGDHGGVDAFCNVVTDDILSGADRQGVPAR